ncbi:homoserine kinase [Actinomycetaceae bacterium TAE3-ERU4]|nr:homoserine kinase [Actinomycetaceae bacterium TAE3-ERU4]
MKNKIQISIPATSANLGPGFDCLGLALGLYNHFTCQPYRENIILGEVCGPKDETNLFIRAYNAVKALVAAPKNAGIRVHFDCEIPPARGLGSSAALIVGGAIAANELFEAKLSHTQLLQICSELEGHPDNVAPALFGGLTASFTSVKEDGETFAYTQKTPLDGRFKFVVLIPSFELSTAASRRVLPKQIAFGDATYNLSHALGLTLALGQGNSTIVKESLEDRLHQPYRGTLINDYERIQRIAKETGALGAVISGAGPSVLTIWDSCSYNQLAAKLEAEKLDAVWQARYLPVCPTGAVIS